MRLTFILGEIWTGLRRNLSMAISVMLVTMVSVFFLGFGVLAQRQVDTMKGYWYDRIQVSIFLCADKSDLPNCAGGPVSDAQKKTIAAQLDQMKPLVKQVYFETQQQAYDRLKQSFADTALVKDVKPDQMPSSFRVQLSDPTKYALISSSFLGAPGVGDVQDQRKVLDPLFRVLDTLRWGAWGLAALMVFCSVLLVATTIRQTAFSRRRETGIMRLVGASAFVIQLPFILETLLATLVGAGVAVGALWATVRYGVSGFLAEKVQGTSFITVSDVWLTSPWLALSVAVLAMLTSWFTLRRYLRV